MRPSLRMAAASVSLSRLVSSACGNVPGRIVRISSPSTSGFPSAADAASDGGDAGNHLGVEAIGQPLVHVHVGAVEEWIAGGEQRDGSTGREVNCQPFGSRFVEFVHRALVSAGMINGLGGHGVDEVFFDLSFAHVRRCNSAGDALAVPRGVERNHIGLADDAGGLDGHQFGIAGADTDTPELACTHSTSLAIALTTAAVIALAAASAAENEMIDPAGVFDEGFLRTRQRR